MPVPHRKHLRASTTFYRDSYTLVYVDDVRFEVFTAVTMKNGVFWYPHDLTSQKTSFFYVDDVPTSQETLEVLHGLLQG
jgi:uncharacterized protein YbcV (DUF1398 family)